MERRARRAAIAALAMILAGCGGGSASTTLGASGDAGWMDGATVQVTSDATAGRQRVVLRDPATGATAVVDDEPLTEGAVEFEDE
jgi:hypothetical protein